MIIKRSGSGISARVSEIELSVPEENIIARGREYPVTAPRKDATPGIGEEVILPPFVKANRDGSYTFYATPNKKIKELCEQWKI